MLVSQAPRQFKRFIKKLFFPAPNPPPASPPGKRQEFSIGIYIGQSPLQLVPPEKLENPVLTREHVSDVPAIFVADPFMLKVEHAWYMFFEVWNRQTDNGEIGLATSEDGMKWTYQKIVLAEPFHLSYPYVFEWMNDYYMIPESHEASSVRLYKALQFPTQWSFVGTLLSKPLSKARFVDTSIFRFDSKWWLFTRTNPRSKPVALCLYHADNLLGPWYEHRKNPLIRNNIHIARPGGRVLPFNGTIIRYAQDSDPVYGSHVRACAITELTTTKYREREVTESPILTGSGVGWNGAGMHHLDPHLMADGRWIACVDGWNWVSVADGNPRAEV